MARRKKLETALENLLTSPPENPEAMELEIPEAAEPPDVPDAQAVVGAPPPAEDVVVTEAPAGAAPAEEVTTLPEAASVDADGEAEPPSALESPPPAEGREASVAVETPAAAVDVLDVVDAEQEEVEEDEDEEFVFAEELAAEVEAEAPGTERQLVILTLADEWYGMNIAAVEQIIELQRITPVPHTPPYIAGLTNLRGAVLPVVDLRRRLGLPTGEPTRETRIVVAQVHQMQVGMIVDAVTEVLRVPERAIEPPSPLVTPVDAMYMTGIAKVADPGGERNAERLIVLLDLEQVLPGVRGH